MKRYVHEHHMEKVEPVRQGMVENKEAIKELKGFTKGNKTEINRVDVHYKDVC